MAVVILSEKPSVARDIAAVLGLSKRGQGFLAGKEYTITWAFGHLVALAEPHRLNERWKQWSLADLPMVPEAWELDLVPQTAEQFALVAKLFNDPATTSLICATDAGREGELIFRYIYEKAGCQKPVQRLWISSLTPEAIQEGFAHLRPVSEFDALAQAAKARSRADWLVGMNLSRAYSLRSGLNFSVGRVQTPTLAILAERERAIHAFVPEDYYVVEATLESPESDQYKAFIVDFPAREASGKLTTLQSKRFHPDAAEISELMQALGSDASIAIARLEEKTSRLPAPQFYDLTELQRHANRLYGLSAQHTLDILQELYERYKVITYPRTDSRYLPDDMRDKASDLARQLWELKESQLATLPDFSPLGKRYIDSNQVRDHHAIIPSGKDLDGRALAGDHARVFDLICRRLLMAFFPDAVSSKSDALLTIHGPKGWVGERFALLARGRRLLEKGWKCLESSAEKSFDREKVLPDGLAIGQRQKLLSVAQQKRQTHPPPRYTDASLLTAMEFAGAALTDKKLAAAMRGHGLGTPATRAQMIETLIKRQYMVREQKALRVLEKGLSLIDSVHSDIKSPKLTGEWEYRLLQMERGRETLENFTNDIVAFVSEMTRMANSVPTSGEGYVSPASSGAGSVAPRDGDGLPGQARTATVPVAQNPSLNLTQVLKQRFGFSAFRPHQEAVCRDLVAGRDVLLVMPTGAGKSLCYQLPGLALGGRTLVISPLIALMDDQVRQLRARGLTAAAIHSGKSRSESQEICRSFAAGDISFLFVAPERLGVPGFIPFLSQCAPQLIAIDEAHCISQWGHDFRFDYRRLGERLQPLQAAMRIAMTATATQRVQADIVSQLGLRDPVMHVHGFRRTNIAITQWEAPKSERIHLAEQVLRDRERCPCIIYAPTRRDAEATALALSGQFRVAAYHAGMDTDSRHTVQEAFQCDNLDIIVATVAFGMGIDKPNVRTVIHLAVPSSLEGYYQEIGRAGRDGQPAHAYLLTSYADLRTHEYFLRRNYPEPLALEKFLAQLPAQNFSPDLVQHSADDGDSEQKLDRLRLVGAIEIQSNGMMCRTNGSWQQDYKEQRAYRFRQLEEMHRYVQELAGCRMLRLLEHFGDPDAAGPRCGLCDLCVPQSLFPQKQRHLSEKEQASLKAVWEYLRIEGKPTPSGRLFRDCGATYGLERAHFERLLDSLVRSQELAVKELHFEKEGRTIPYRTFTLLRQSPSQAWSERQIMVTEGRQVAKTRQKNSGDRKRRSREHSGQPHEASGLLAQLKDWRRQVAQERKIPAYCILSNKSLEALVTIRPRTLEDLHSVAGIGQSKLEQFGSSLLGMIRSADSLSG